MIIKEFAKEILDQLSIRPAAHADPSARDRLSTERLNSEQGELRRAIELRIKEMLTKCELVTQEDYELQAKELELLKKHTLQLEAKLKAYETALSQKVGDLDEFLAAAHRESDSTSAS